MDLMLMVGSGKLRNTLSWFEFLMKKEFKLLFFTLKANLNSGGEAHVAVLLIYHGINSVQCWVTNSMKHPLVMLLVNFIV